MTSVSFRDQSAVFCTILLCCSHLSFSFLLTGKHGPRSGPGGVDGPGLSLTGCPGDPDAGKRESSGPRMTKADERRGCFGRSAWAICNSAQIT